MKVSPGDARLLAIANCFALGGRPRSVAPAGEGLINDSYRVDCEDQAFLLQRLNPRVFARPALVMENIQRVTGHLVPRMRHRHPQDWERRVLQLMPTRDGNPALRDSSGHWWRVFRFVKDSLTYQSTPDAGTAYAAARAFGVFVRDLADLPGPPLHETITGFHDTPARLEALLRAVDQDRFNRAPACEKALEQILRHRRLADSLKAVDLPTRAVHNDTKINNVLFDASGRQACCVVDLDTVMPGSPLHDFGDLVRSAAAMQQKGGMGLDIELFDALLKGWLSGMGETLGVQEKELIAISPQVITLELAIRFLTDYLEGDCYFKVQSAEQNLQRSLEQLTLLASMRAQEDRMRRRIP